MRKIELFNDHFQNYKVYGIPKAQLIIADPPYNLGKNAYASNPAWYKDGDNKNGESELAGKEFFDTDKIFDRQNLCTSVRKCLLRSQNRKGNHLAWFYSVNLNNSSSI